MNRLRELTEEIRKERGLLIAAMNFDNQRAINRSLYKLTVLNSRMSDFVMDILEKVRYTNTSNTISSAISPNVNIAEDSALHFGSPDGFTDGK